MIKILILGKNTEGGKNEKAVGRIQLLFALYRFYFQVTSKYLKIIYRISTNHEFLRVIVLVPVVVVAV